MFNDTAILTVNVVDVNDNAPMFQNTPYTFTLAENLPVDPTMAIGKVTAIDDDSGQNKEVWKVNVYSDFDFSFYLHNLYLLYSVYNNVHWPFMVILYCTSY